MNRTILTLCFLLLLFVFNCATGNAAEKNAAAGQFQVVFADSKWDGKTIPYGQQCYRDGGKGSTPPLLIRNIPSEANALIFEYSDASYAQMNNGGHGKIGYSIQPGTAEITVPPVPGNTMSIPEGFFLISAHVNPSWDKAGAYLPPCSGGRGNSYYVIVKAVVRSVEKDQKPIVLGTMKLNLGNY
jgi:hypothetical protein